MKSVKSFLSVVLLTVLGSADLIAAPVLPVINTNNILNILNFGAVSSTDGGAPAPVTRMSSNGAWAGTGTEATAACARPA